MARFDDCLAVVLKNEGGYVDNPADRGGATNMGVTQGTYDAYRRRAGLPVQPVKFISRDEVGEIYESTYWAPADCVKLPIPVDLCVFDTAVNSGCGRAARLLEEAVGTATDGLIGPVTLAAVAKLDPRAVAEQFLDQREQFYHDIVTNNPSQQIFLEGWLNRVNALRDICGIPRH